jgi:hypothetical protein
MAEILGYDLLGYHIWVTLLYQSLGNTLCQDLGDTLLF